MELIDYHTHNELCNHAYGSIEDYIQMAKAKNLTEIGISDHFPMISLPKKFHKYSMKIDQLDFYISKVKHFKEKSSALSIKLAFEVDFFNGTISDLKRTYSSYFDDIDYLIGSVHVLKSPFDSKSIIDLAKPIILDERDNPDIIFETYYELIFKLVKEDFFQIIGHFDLPKKYHLAPKNEELIHEKIMKIIDIIPDYQIAVEINTSGFRKPVKEQYPSNQIIEALIDHKIPLTLGSDAHKPQDIAYKFPEVLQFLKQRGLKKLYKFDQREMIAYKI